MRERIGPLLTIIVCILLLFFAILTLFFSMNSYVKYTYIMVLYIITAILIWLEQKNLPEFNMDRLSVTILLVSCVFRRRLGVNHEEVYLIIIGMAGIIILISAILNWDQLTKTTFRWLIISLFVACVSVILIGFFELVQPQVLLNHTLRATGVFWNAVRSAIYELSFTAPIEEIIFRGFVWGYLRKLKLSVNKIFWAQGLLFWLLHINRIINPIIFFVAIPILTFGSSELAKRSSQLSPSILYHIAVNSLTSVFLLT